MSKISDLSVKKCISIPDIFCDLYNGGAFKGKPKRSSLWDGYTEYAIRCTHLYRTARTSSEPTVLASIY